MEKQINWTKWSALGLGGLLGLSHISMIVMLSTRSNHPQIKLPDGPYASYRMESGENGYRVEYRANDPKTLYTTKNVLTGDGLFKKGNRTTFVQEYTMDGAVHHGGPVSNGRTWIDPAALGKGEKKISAKTEACIEARGGGKQTGKIVGGSVGAAVAPSVSSVPFVGWVLAGAATMIGMNKGADLGADMAESFSDDC
jgi:hypothetical protein